MRATVLLIGGATIVALAFGTDAGGTTKLIVGILTIGGVTFLMEKVASAINHQSGQIIKFTGYALASIGGLKILKMAIENKGLLVGTLKVIAKVVKWGASFGS